MVVQIKREQSRPELSDAPTVVHQHSPPPRAAMSGVSRSAAAADHAAGTEADAEAADDTDQPRRAATAGTGQQPPEGSASPFTGDIRVLASQPLLIAIARPDQQVLASIAHIQEQLHSSKFDIN